MPEKIDYDDCMLFIHNCMVRKFLNKPVLIFEGNEINYAQFKELITKIVASLNGIKLKTGNTVAKKVLKASYFLIFLKKNSISVMTRPVYSNSELEQQINYQGSKGLSNLCKPDSR